MALLKVSAIREHFRVALEMHSRHLEDIRKMVADPLIVEGLYSKTQQYTLPAYNLHRTSMEAFNELIGIRHVLEMDIYDLLNTPAYAYTDYTIDEVKEATMAYRPNIEKLAKIVNEMCELMEQARIKEGIPSEAEYKEQSGEDNNAA